MPKLVKKVIVVKRPVTAPPARTEGGGGNNNDDDDTNSSPPQQQQQSEVDPTTMSREELEHAFLDQHALLAEQQTLLAVKDRIIGNLTTEVALLQQQLQQPRTRSKVVVRTITRSAAPRQQQQGVAGPEIYAAAEELRRQGFGMTAETVSAAAAAAAQEQREEQPAAAAAAASSSSTSSKHLLSCSECHQQLPKSEFSNTQAKKPVGRKCKQCVAKVAEVESANLELGKLPNPADQPLDRVFLCFPSLDGNPGSFLGFNESGRMHMSTTPFLFQRFAVQTPRSTQQAFPDKRGTSFVLLDEGRTNIVCTLHNTIHASNEVVIMPLALVRRTIDGEPCVTVMTSFEDGSCAMGTWMFALQWSGPRVIITIKQQLASVKSPARISIIDMNTLRQCQTCEVWHTRGQSHDCPTSDTESSTSSGPLLTCSKCKHELHVSEFSDSQARKLVGRKCNHCVCKAAKANPQDVAVLVSNLPFQCNWRLLRETFAQVATVVRADIAIDKDGMSRGFGYVVFKNLADAQLAIDEFDGVEMGGRPLSVRM